MTEESTGQEKSDQERLPTLTPPISPSSPKTPPQKDSLAAEQDGTSKTHQKVKIWEQVFQRSRDAQLGNYTPQKRSPQQILEEICEE